MRTRSSARLRLILRVPAVVALGFLAAQVGAQTPAGWTGLGDGLNWTNANNWNPPAVPNVGPLDAPIHAVDLPTRPQGLLVRLISSEAIEVHSLSVGLNATLNVRTSTHLEVYGGGIHNAGLIHVGDGTGSTASIGIAASYSLSGGGTIFLDRSNLVGSIDARATTTETLTNVDNLIRGAGAICSDSGRSNAMRLINRATVSADVAGQELLLEPLSQPAGMINSALMRATGGGRLSFVSRHPGDVDEVQNFDVVNGATVLGTIRAEPGSVVAVRHGVTVRGGNVIVDGNGTVDVIGGITDGTITNSPTGTIGVTASSTVATLGGVISNPAGGLISVTGGSTTLRLSTGTTLDNAGTFRVTNATKLLAQDTLTFAGGGVLELGSATPRGTLVMENASAAVAELIVNGAGHTIRGRGFVGRDFGTSDPSGSLINRGLIVADVAGQTLEVAARSGVGDQFINRGTLRATAGATMRIQANGALTLNNVEDAAAGTIDIDANSRLVTNASISGGTIDLAGTLEVSSAIPIALADVTMNAAAGGSFRALDGLVTLGGQYHFAAGSSMAAVNGNIQFGTSAVVSGAAAVTIGGSRFIGFDNAAAAAIGDVTSSGSLNVNGPLAAGNVDGGTVDVRAGQQLVARRARPATLLLRDNATLRLSDGQPGVSDEAVSRVTTINWAATNPRIDLGDEALVKDYANGTSDVTMLNDLRPRVLSGRAGGAWTGPGIASSVAAGDARYAVGYATARQLFSAFPSTWMGQAIDETTLLLRVTRTGDANLDGAVGFDDLLSLAQNYGGAGVKHWASGDFDFDTAVGFGDLLALAQNYGQPAAFEADWLLAQGLVPEPTNAAAVMVATPLALRRRRRLSGRSGCGPRPSTRTCRSRATPR